MVALPSFSRYPRQEVTVVGEYLMGLPQALEVLSEEWDEVHTEDMEELPVRWLD